MRNKRMLGRMSEHLFSLQALWIGISSFNCKARMYIWCCSVVLRCQVTWTIFTICGASLSFYEFSYINHQSRSEILLHFVFHRLKTVLEQHEESMMKRSKFFAEFSSKHLAHNVRQSDRHSTSRASLGDSFMLHENRQEKQKEKRTERK